MLHPVHSWCGTATRSQVHSVWHWKWQHHLLVRPAALEIPRANSSGISWSNQRRVALDWRDAQTNRSSAHSQRWFINTVWWPWHCLVNCCYPSRKQPLEPWTHPVLIARSSFSLKEQVTFLYTYTYNIFFIFYLFKIKRGQNDENGINFGIEINVWDILLVDLFGWVFFLKWSILRVVFFMSTFQMKSD